MPKSHVQLVNEYLNQDVYHFTPEKIRKMQDELITATFKFHYANCMDYRKYCQGKGIDPSQVTSIEDVYKIPLLDSRETLRKRQFFSVPKEQIKYNFSSTGSSGKPLIWIGMDQITLDWLIKANIAYLFNFLPLENGKTLLMLPDVPQLKFATVIKNIFPFLKQKLYFGLKLKFKPKAKQPDILPDFEIMREFAKDDGLAKSIVGFPYALLLLRDWMKEHDFHFTLGKNGYVITGGGWKPRDPQNKYGKRTRDELEEEISRLLDVPRENIRDFFGATESIMGIPECVHYEDGKMVKTLHVSPFCYVYAVSIEDLKPLPPGKPGIGVIIDFLARSYPGFILTDDIIVVKQNPCPCGIAGQTIEYVERVSELEERGCAFKIQDQLFSDEYLKIPSEPPGFQRDGLISYIIKNRIELGGDDIKSHEEIFKMAMKTIADTVSFQLEDGQMTRMVILGKILCYKKGKPTYMTLEEIAEALPEMKRDEIESMLQKFKKRKFVRAKTIDGFKKYYLTKKADEFGEAFFPLLIWALKYS
ncbi:MAG: LuxE/PaaK family acyltransferase [Candidatus Helarchaeota archaeon]